MLNNRTLELAMFQGDNRHIAQPLHRGVGDMVVAYLQSLMCLNDKAEPEDGLWPTTDHLGTIPPVRSSLTCNSGL